MNRGEYDRSELLRTTSTLLLGSVADDLSSSPCRASDRSRYSGSYDPFAGVPQNRYSPPRTILLDNADSRYQIQVQDTLCNRSALASYPPSSASHPNTRLGTNRNIAQGAVRSIDNVNQETSKRRTSDDSVDHNDGSPTNHDNSRFQAALRGQTGEPWTTSTHQPGRRRTVNQDEFDGPSQYLPLPLPTDDQRRIQNLPELAVHLDTGEQSEVMRIHNDTLADCAFHFVAKYQFPIPLERERLPVRKATDRDWAEWAYLLKRLATKRRIPARVLHAHQIKNLVTILENSVTVRHPTQRDQTNSKRIPRDDRYILQLLSAGIQVARILMDSLAMVQLITLYDETETIILERRRQDHIAMMHYQM